MIFITGHHNSGKSTISRYLTDFGFIHIETGDIIREMHKKLAPETEFFIWAENMGDRLNDFIVSRVLLARQIVLNSSNTLQDIVISGNRQLSGINYIIENVSPVNKRKNIIIFICADEKILFWRQRNRSDRKILGLTLTKFKEEIMGYDIKMGINGIKEKASIIVINNSSLNDFKINIKKRLAEVGYRI